MDKTILKQKVNQLNEMIQNGKALEAFEHFYANDIVMQENGETPTIGKQSCRVNEEVFLNGIQEFRKADIKNVVVSDNLSVVEWDFDFTHKDWGTRNYTQLAVQRWNDDGQIINENFYYNN